MNVNSLLPHNTDANANAAAIALEKKWEKTGLPNQNVHAGERCKHRGGSGAPVQTRKAVRRNRFRR